MGLLFFDLFKKKKGLAIFIYAAVVSISWYYQVNDTIENADHARVVSQVLGDMDGGVGNNHIHPRAIAQAADRPHYPSADVQPSDLQGMDVLPATVFTSQNSFYKINEDEDRAHGAGARDSRGTVELHAGVEGEFVLDSD